MKQCRLGSLFRISRECNRQIVLKETKALTRFKVGGGGAGQRRLSGRGSGYSLNRFLLRVGVIEFYSSYMKTGMFLNTA